MVWVVNAAPLGPVTAYSYLHAGREPAILFVETRLLFFLLSCVGEGHVLLLVVSFTSRSPFRIRFVAPQYGSDSGWHGVCYRREQTPYSSEVTLTLNGFRFSGLAADWTHDNCVFTWRPRLHSFRCTSWGGDPRSRDITLLEMLFPPPTPSLEL